MDILGKARKLESKLARTLDRTAQQWTRSGPRGPLEVLHAIVETVEEGLEPAGRGTHMFPFNRMKVWVLATSRDARARFSGLFEAAPTLQARVRDRLRSAGCEGPAPQIRIVFVDRPAPVWTRPDFHVEFERTTAADGDHEAAPNPKTIRITIVHGTAERTAYAIALPRINLGRGAEVRDHRNQLIRTNHVTFPESASGPNATVSRRHAHIEYRMPGQFRVYDDGSAHGTGIVRNGRTTNVPPGTRGIALRSGDELLLGEARLRIRLDS